MGKFGSGGRLSIVLHAHMPYVEGYGEWPVGEEWLWEAVAKSYLPLLEVLDDHPGKVTLSVTPVLAEQLDAPDVRRRLLKFLDETRVETHATDVEHFSGEPDVVRALERSAADYESAADRLSELRRGGLLEGFERHRTWRSSVTHAALPLLATDDGIAEQLRRPRSQSGPFADCLWLPECAYAPWLDEPLARAGVRFACVDISGFDRNPRPVGSRGLILIPIDRPAIDLVWARDGYPSNAAYRDSHNFTPSGHMVWANDGAVYDADRAHEQAVAHAVDFLDEVQTREGHCVFAIDAELLGLHWHEGVWWLRAVLEKAKRRGTHLDLVERSVRTREVRRKRLPPCSWGAQRDLSTWSGPAVADMAFAARDAELRVFGGSPSEATLRELRLLQSSDWAFMVSTDRAAQYGRERFDGHLKNLRLG